MIRFCALKRKHHPNKAQERGSIIQNTDKNDIKTL